jgi:hypothetical protein
VGMSFWSSVRDQDLGSVFGCRRILWLTLRAESLPYIIYFVRTLVLVGLLPAFMCSRVTWFLRTGISLYTTRGLYSVPVYSFLALLLMMIRPTMLGLAVREGMAASYMRHVNFFGLCVLLPFVSTCGGPTDCVGTDSSGCHPVGLPFIGIGNSLSETVEQNFMCYIKAFIRSFY